MQSCTGHNTLLLSMLSMSIPHGLPRVCKTDFQPMESDSWYEVQATKLCKVSCVLKE